MTTALPHSQFRASAQSRHTKRIARLAELGRIGQDVIALLEQQGSNAGGVSGIIPAVPILKMESSAWMHDAADFGDFIHAADLGLPDDAPRDILYVEVYFSDEREPGMPPVRIAATLHLGEVIEDDIT